MGGRPHGGVPPTRHLFSLLLLLLLFTPRTSLAISLDEALLKDMLPPSPATCRSPPPSSQSSSTTTFPANDTDANSYWHEPYRQFESHLFGAELRHEDPDPVKSWAIRIGKNGIIYSFRGAFGEAMPPQVHTDAPWIDEVWQMVAVDQGKNAAGPANFVHHAGVYTRTDGLRELPFYSPLLASHCDENECIFASWGQHAHLATPYRSRVVYITRFRNCGDGVVETTWMMHSLRLDGFTDVYSYFNVPWGGVAWSPFGDLAVASPSGTLNAQTDPERWGVVSSKSLVNLDQTGGFLVFGKELPRSSLSFSPPSGVSLVVGYNNPCAESGGHSANAGTPVFTLRLAATGNSAAGTVQRLLLHNGRGESMRIKGVHHWATAGHRLFFYPTTATVAQCNAIFQKDDVVTVSIPEPVLASRDNPVISFITGKDDSGTTGGTDGWWWDKARGARFRLGFAGGGLNKRDFFVWTVNVFPVLTAGTGFFFSQFVSVGELADVTAKSNSLTGSTSQGFISDYGELSEHRGRAVSLYRPSGDGSGGEFQAVLEGDEAHAATVCALVCTGTTTPRRTHQALFLVTCGTNSSVTHNPYELTDIAAAPANIKAWDCGTAAGSGARPSWKLLGFFPKDSCSTVNPSAQLDETVCVPSPSPTPSGSASPSPSPSGSASASMTRTPSGSASPSPTSSGSPSVTQTPSGTQSMTSTPSPSPSTTPTSSHSHTPSSTPSRTPSPSGSPSRTPSPSGSPSRTPSPSGSPSRTPSPSPSPSPTPSHSPSPTASPFLYEWRTGPWSPQCSTSCGVTGTVSRELSCFRLTPSVDAVPTSWCLGSAAAPPHVAACNRRPCESTLTTVEFTVEVDDGTPAHTVYDSVRSEAAAELGVDESRIVVATAMDDGASRVTLQLVMLDGEDAGRALLSSLRDGSVTQPTLSLVDVRTTSVSSTTTTSSDEAASVKTVIGRPGSGQDDGLSTGAWVGVGIACFLAVAGATVVVTLAVLHRRSSGQPSSIAKWTSRRSRRRASITGSINPLWTADQPTPILTPTTPQVSLQANPMLDRGNRMRAMARPQPVRSQTSSGDSVI